MNYRSAKNQASDLDAFCKTEFNLQTIYAKCYEINYKF